MEINVAQLLKSPIGSTRDYDVQENIDCGQGEHPVEGKVKLTRTNRGILVGGTLRTETQVTCSRCLREFTCPLTLKIEDEYFPTIGITTGAPVAVPDEPGAYTIDEHHVLDLTGAICEYSVLAVPMKPLCREACAGLCPQCGKDLNRGPCSCPPQEIDSRWSKLLKHRSHTSPARQRKKKSS